MPEVVKPATSDAIPGGDLTFDQIFGSESDTSLTAGAANPTNADSQTTTTQPAAQLTQVVQPSWELKSTDGTINYKSAEAALEGIQHKDALIQQLRDKYKAVTGVDPIKPLPIEPQAPESYIQNPTRFAEDLAAAAKEGNAQKYTQTQLRLVEEYIAPFRPIMQDFTRSRAQAQVTSEIAEFAPFRTSDDFQKTLTRNPALAQAIQGAETNPQFAQQLPELYRLAYQSHVASRVPELVQAAQAAAATQVAPVRQQASAQSTLTPGNPTTAQSSQEMLRTKEGRAEIKRQFEASAGMNQDWANLRW